MRHSSIASIARLLALFGTSMLVIFLSLRFTGTTEKIATIWPFNALVLALLHWQPRSRWPAILATAFLADALTGILMHVPIRLTIGFAMANQVEIILCAGLLYGEPGAFRLDNRRALIRFVLLAGGAGPACSAFIASLLLVHVRPMAETFLAWFTSDALGMMVFAPALLILGSAPDRLYRASSNKDRLLAVVGVAAALIVVFAQHSYPILFVIPGALALASFKLGMRGAAAGILATAAVAIASTIVGIGPIHLSHGDRTEQILLLQAFLGFVSLTILPIASALERSQGILDNSQAANEALTKARQAAEEARTEALEHARRYRDLAEYTTDIVLRYGPGGVISYASPAIRSLALEPEEVAGKKVPELFVEEDQERARAVVSKIFETPPDRIPPRREFRARNREGQVIWLESSPNVIRDPAGQALEVVSVYRDVSRRRMMEAALDQARISAEKTASANAAFLANMSHELRTPLNSIVGFSQLLRNAKLADPRHQRFIEVIADSSLGLLSVVNDVLDYSSLEAGAMRLEIQSFSVIQLAHQVIESVRMTAEDKGLEPVLELDPKLADAYLGDEGKIRQVLLNLLSNAIKFTDAGKVSLSVNVTDSGSGQHRLTFAAIDTGLGIPEHQLGMLFDRFKRLDGYSGPRGRQRPGTGDRQIPGGADEGRFIGRFGAGQGNSFSVCA